MSSQSSTEKVMASLEAERAVLGSCLLGDLSVLEQVSQLLDEGDLYSTAHRRIWRWMLREKQAGNAPDVLALADWMQAGGQERIDSCGGLVFATSLPEMVPTYLEAPRYVQIVKRTARKRKLLELAGRIREEVYHDSEPEKVIGLIQAGVEAARERRRPGTGGDVPIAEACDRVAVQFQEEQDALGKGQGAGISTGFKDLDKRLVFLRQESVMVCGRPGMGKSMLALHIAKHIAQAEQRKGPQGVVYIASLEMGEKELVHRWVATFSGLPYTWLLKGKPRADGSRGPLSREEMDRWDDALALLRSLPIVINETPARSIEDLRRSCLRLNHDRDLVAAVLDYLQLAESEDPDIQRHQVERLGHIANGGKAIAKECECVFISAVQLNRAVEGRSDKRPVMSDLRGSGELEQAANIIVGLYRDEYYNPETTTAPGRAEAILLKERNGESGHVVELGFKRGLFFNLSNSDASVDYGEVY